MNKSIHVNDSENQMQVSCVVMANILSDLIIIVMIIIVISYIYCEKHKRIESFVIK